MENPTDQINYTPAYVEFHKIFETTMNSVVSNLNSNRSSEDVATVIRGTEDMESKWREFPFNLPEDQASNLRQLGDVLDEAKFKYTHTRKQEIAEQNKLLKAQIDAWGLPTKPLEAPFQVILSKKKGRKNSGDNSVESKKAKTDDLIPTQNKFGELTVSNTMDITDPLEGISTSVVHPGATAPQKKFHVPPITIDNVTNQAALLKHLQKVTKLKLEAKLIGSKFRIFPQTPYAYTLIRRYIAENNLEDYTYMLPEDKKLRAVIRGLPVDMPPMEIISDLETQGFCIEECHNMVSRKSGAPMPLFMLSMERSEKHKSIFTTVTTIGYVKVTVEILRKKYGPPQCFRCQGFFHSSKFCTRTPRKEATKSRPHRYGATQSELLGASEHKLPHSTNSLLQLPNPDPPPKPVNSQNSHTDLFDQLKNPAVQDTFDLLEQFIVIATTIPTKYGRLRAIRQLLGEEIQKFNPRHNNIQNLTLVSWNANRIRTRVEEFREFISEWNPDIINLHKRPTFNLVTTSPSPTTISTGQTAPFEAAEPQF
ncbi:putative RNA-directed DNA polymerase from transposon X-element [Trichonephila clavata]|uniref:Putative RNA-directed DNA polymerase from transposon X-element n=1 Tax=Trichonephila clavata TaxID=2740835 RepID=A0A8X6F3E4_TRICU|nr:putative RNA-directed DNA polymerase from transposon X-element [Trichonephila clavata]